MVYLSRENNVSSRRFQLRTACVSLCAFALLVAVPLISQAQQAFSRVEFVAKEGETCSANKTPPKILEDGSALIVPVDSTVLDVGAGSSRLTSFSCSFRVHFRNSLLASGAVQLTFTPFAAKDPRSNLRMDVLIGPQVHRIEYQRGRVFEPENNPNSFFRAQLFDLPKGTQSFRVKLSGTAVSIDGVAIAQLALDSIQICNVDPAVPELCGALPNKPKLPN